LPDRLRGRVDVLVANTPYVPTGAIGLLPPEARLHEPRVALDGGADGLAVLRRVVAGARRWLAPGGRLFLELGEDQVATACELVAAAGLAVALGRDPETGGTVVSGRLPQHSPQWTEED
jgi:release factor glutamine methyltransferase